MYAVGYLDTAQVSLALENFIQTRFFDATSGISPALNPSLFAPRAVR
jgi:hypothetical protein